MASTRCYFIGTNLGDTPVPQHFRALGKALALRGHRVVLLVHGQREPVCNPESNPAIFTAPSRRPTRLRDAAFILGLFRAYRPDCVVANFAWVNWLTTLGWLTRVPARVVWYHTLSAASDIDGDLPKWRLALLRTRKRLVYKLATHLVPVSKATQMELCSDYGVPPRRMTVFLNALADPNVEAAGVEHRRLLCVARFARCKGQDVLLRALGILKRLGVAFRAQFVGDGVLRKECIALADSVGVRDLCEFTGQLRHDDVLVRLAAAGCSVIPSRVDACPLIAIESLAVGRPAIASAVGGIPEIIREGVDGFLVRPEDPVALADRIRVLVENPKLADEMGRNGRERFLARFEQGRAIQEQVVWLENVAGATFQTRGPSGSGGAWSAGDGPS